MGWERHDVHRDITSTCGSRIHSDLSQEDMYMYVIHNFVQYCLDDYVSVSTNINHETTTSF